MIRAWAAVLLLAAPPAWPQSRSMVQGRHRMEIMLERQEAGAWRQIDPGLVLAQGDRVRFRFSANFNGYLYVTNLNSSGVYEQLFPTEGAGRENQVTAGREVQVPAETGLFRVAGPPGYETVYWLVSPARIEDPASRPAAPRPGGRAPVLPDLKPRCDDAILRARGECIDGSAGPKLVPRGAELPGPLAQAAGQTRRDLLFLRDQDKSVISSPEPLTGPVVYEFRLAHR